MPIRLEGAYFIAGQNITVDGRMTRLIIYDGDNGWLFPPAADTMVMQSSPQVKASHSG